MVKVGGILSRQSFQPLLLTFPYRPCLRERIKALELEAERELLTRLEALAQAWPLSQLLKPLLQNRPLSQPPNLLLQNQLPSQLLKLPPQSQPLNQLLQNQHRPSQLHLLLPRPPLQPHRPAIRLHR